MEMDRVADVKPPSFEETVGYTKESLGSLLHTLRDFYINEGYSEQDASLEATKAGYQALNEFSQEALGKKVPTPSATWMEEYDALLKDIRNKREYFPVYQKLLLIRKKLKEVSK